MLPNNHRIRKAEVQSSESIGGEKGVGRENLREEEKDEKEEKKKE